VPALIREVAAKAAGRWTARLSAPSPCGASRQLAPYL